MATIQAPQQEPTSDDLNHQSNAHNVYIKQVSRSMLDSFIQKVPEEKVDSLFYKVVRLEQENAPEPDLFLTVIADVFREIVPDNGLLHEKLKLLMQLPEDGKSRGTDETKVDYVKTLSTAEAVAQTERNRQALSKMVKGNALIGYQIKGEKSASYPAWQFVGKNVVPGLESVLSMLKFNGEEATNVLTRPIKSERDLSIAQLLRMGDLDGAVRATRFELRFRELTAESIKAGGDALFNATSSMLKKAYRPGRTETI